MSLSVVVFRLCGKVVFIDGIRHKGAETEVEAGEDAPEPVRLRKDALVSPRVSLLPWAGQGGRHCAVLCCVALFVLFLSIAPGSGCILLLAVGRLSQWVKSGARVTHRYFFSGHDFRQDEELIRLKLKDQGQNQA